MDPKQRLQLNFGGGYGNDRNYDPSNNRVFPTTPSTFPQPVFGNQGGNTPNAYTQQGQSQYGGASGPSYFPQMNENRTSVYGTQYQQYHQQNLAAPPQTYQQRQGGYNPNSNNDPTSNLAHQFSNQNLGAPARQASPLGRQPSPNSRFYPNSQQHMGQQRAQGGYNSSQRTPPTLLTPPGQDPSGRGPPPGEEPPEKRPDRFSQNVLKRGHGLHTFVEAFFRENITRARERNVR